MFIKYFLKIWENHVLLVFQGPKTSFSNPTGIYLFKAHSENTRAMCKICSKLTIKKKERGHWCYVGILSVNYEQISHIFLVLPLLALNK